MAIIANRIKNYNSVLGLTKFIFVNLKRLSILFFIIISICLFIVSPQKISAIFLEITGDFVYVVAKMHGNIFKKINLISQNFVYFKNLAKENAELQIKLEQLQHLQSDIYSLQTENIELKKLLSIVEVEEPYKRISAKLLSVSLNPFSKTAIVSAGTKQGVAVDLIVTNSEGLVGRIIQVSENYSKIILVEDVNSRIPITTTSSKEKGIMSNDEDGSKILYLPKTHLVQKGEKIVTSGYGNIYPYGITVGYVQKVNEETVVVQPVVDLSKTEFVNIIIDFPK